MPISKIKAGGINDDAVTTAKIVDGTVAAVDIADGAVTSAKLDTNIAITGNLTADTDTLYVDATNDRVGINSGTSPQRALHATADGVPVARFERDSSAGAIVEFRNSSNVTFGSIGNDSTEMFVNMSSTNNTGFASGTSGGDSVIFPAGSNGAVRDNAIDLGYSTGRWKDLFLSGGVYLGGTTSVNYLEDYEEGTFTPAYTFSTSQATITYNSQLGEYVKVGGLVHFSISLYTASLSGGSGYLWISGLPFTSGAGSSQGGASLGYHRSWATNFTANLALNVADSQTTVRMHINNSTAVGPTYIYPSDMNSAGNYLQISGTYKVD
jgi:hypothetical protein